MNNLNNCADLLKTVKQFEGSTVSPVYVNYHKHEFNKDKLIYSVLNVSKDVEYECQKTEQIEIKGYVKVQVSAFNHGFILFHKPTPFNIIL